MYLGKLYLLAGAAALSFVLALFCGYLSHGSSSTPGDLLGPLLFQSFASPPQYSGCCDLRVLGYILLVDMACWFLVLLSIYALVTERRALLIATVAPVCILAALTYDNLAVRYSLFTPGLVLWRWVHDMGPLDHDTISILSVLIDAACLFAALIGARSLVRRLRQKFGNRFGKGATTLGIQEISPSSTLSATATHAGSDTEES